MTGKTQVKTDVVFLGALLSDVMDGKVRTPRFQRPFVWKQSDIHALLDSVVRGFPIGSLLVWETGERPESSDRMGPIRLTDSWKGQIQYILDGQQRLTSLVGALRFDSESDKRNQDNVDWRIFYDLTERMEHAEPKFVRANGDPKPRFFPISSLFDTSLFLSECRRISESCPRDASKLLDAADRLANSFRDCQIPIVRIIDATLDDAVTAFARLNRRGRRMTADQMISALTYQEGQFHLANRLDIFLTRLETYRFNGLGRVFVLRSVLAALGRDIYAKDWANILINKNLRQDLPNAFTSATEALVLAIKFLSKLGVTSDRLLPYGLQVVLIGEFFRLCKNPSNLQLDLIKRWFWVTSFTGWFGGVNTTNARKALEEIRAVARGEQTTFSIVDMEAAALPFPTQFDARSARVRAFLLYLITFRPLSLKGDGDRLLDIGALLAHRGPRALGYLAANSVDLGDSHRSTIGNRMFIDEGVLGHASKALRAIAPSSLVAVLTSHGFSPEADDLLKANDLQQMISCRENFLLEGEREFMRARQVTLPTTQRASTIADSDSDDEG